MNGTKKGLQTRVLPRLRYTASLLSERVSWPPKHKRVLTLAGLALLSPETCRLLPLCLPRHQSGHCRSHDRVFIPQYQRQEGPPPEGVCRASVWGKHLSAGQGFGEGEPMWRLQMAFQLSPFTWSITRRISNRHTGRGVWAVERQCPLCTNTERVQIINSCLNRVGP